MKTSHCHRRAKLRRLDWRFLLPRPEEGVFHHLVVLGGPAGLDERLHEVGLARRISTEIPAGRGVDALVLLQDARVRLGDAVECLENGGVFYQEIDLRSRAWFAATPSRIRRRLRTLGLHRASLYAARPNFEACQFFLPLDVPKALEWFMDTYYCANTPWRWAREAALHLLTKCPFGSIPTWGRYYAAVAVAGSASELRPPSILGLPKFPKTLEHSGMHPLLCTDDGDRLVMLPFRADGDQPGVVLKVPKLPRFNGKTEKEQRTLAEIRAGVDDGLRASIPEPLGIAQYGELVVATETYLPGQSLMRSSSRWLSPTRDKIRDLDLAADWLGRFHERLEVRRLAWEAVPAADWVDKPIADYKAKFGATPAESLLFSRTLNRSAALRNTQLPTVWQHRDYNVWNLFRAGDQLRVIDWEGGRLGLPLCDLLHFAIQWNEIARHLEGEKSRLRGFRRLFAESARPHDAIAMALHESIERYRSRLAIDPRFLPLFLVCTLVELALRRSMQQEAHGELPANPRSGNLWVDYLGVLTIHGTHILGEEE